MLLENYYREENNLVQITREQASKFAKEIADDFNPLHDVDAKRFCVPGDLLFSLLLDKAGLHEKMTFTFTGMVTEETRLNFPSEIVSDASIKDEAKDYVKVSVAGSSSTNQSTIESLTKAYVEFSGHTFPHILVALMAKENVMINPARPMIMYESMSIELNNLDFEDVELVLADSVLSIDGKRGTADLIFDLKSNGEVIGHGKKHMLLSGLRAYEQSVIDEIVNQYNDKKAAYFS